MESTNQSNQNNSVPNLGSDFQVINPNVSVELKKQRLFQFGLLWLLSGIVMMGVSFCMIFCLDHADTFVMTVMYLITALGACLVMKGLFDLLGF